MLLSKCSQWGAYCFSAQYLVISDFMTTVSVVSLPVTPYCVVQVREHAVSFFSSLCDMILAGATSPSREVDTRLTHDLDSRSGSLKRKHVGSTPSLSEAEPIAVAKTSNGSRLHDAVCDEDSSSSSLSACSSDQAICDDLPAEDIYFRNTSTGSSPNSFAELECESHPKPNLWDSSPASTSHCLAISESEFNQNVLPGPGGWMTCPNVSLAAENVVRQSLARVSSIGSGCNVDFEDSDDSVAARSQRVCANVLVVSHGGFISQLLGHFADDFSCCLPGGTKITSTVTPNAGLSRFFVTISRCEDGEKNSETMEYDGKSVWLRCVALHDKDHLANNVDVEPLPTSEPL